MEKNKSLTETVTMVNNVESTQPIARQPRKSTQLIFRLGSVLLLSFCMLLVAFVWLLGLPEIMQAAGPPVRYVAPVPLGNDQGNTNDCANSFTPCATIQRAIDAANNGDEIRVASGRYTDTNNFSENVPRTQAIYLNKPVTLRGGFTTTNWVTSDPSSNPTIVDAQGNGRVLRVPSNVVIVATVDGFHLTGGVATDDSGGGGVLNVNGDLTLENNEIYGNQVIASSALAGGGGVAQTNIAASTTLLHNRIYANTAVSTGNTAIAGGINILSGTFVLQANEIFSNTADSSGGGVVVLDGIIISSESNLIYNNTSINGDGGGFAIGTGNVNIVNDTIYGNSANGNGGGVFIASADVDIINTLIADNTAIASGGVFTGAGNITINFTDFDDNSPNDDINDTVDPTTIGVGNRISDPDFIDPNNYDLRLSASSPAINTGTDVAVAIDFEGQGRPFDDLFDRGADEVITAGATCFARVEGGEVYTNVQEAIDEANSGQLVQVAGVCDVVETVNSLDQIAYISKTLTLRGGYTDTDWIDPIYGPTIFDAQGGGRAIYVDGGTNISPVIENLRLTGGSAISGAGVYLGSSVFNAVLRNNIIYNNSATGGQGGGVYNVSNSSRLRHNTIYDNTASEGAGVYGASGGRIFLNSNIVANNNGDGLAAPTANEVDLDYNNFFNNSPNYSDPAYAGPNDISDDPNFVNAPNDFRLQSDSSSINAADPNSSVTTDFENQERPLGSRADIGADESLFYAEVLLSEAPEDPVVVTNPAVIADSVITFTHTITNLGNTSGLQDTFDITAFNSDNLDITIVPASIPLQAGQSATFEVGVRVPPTVPDPLFNQTIVTATSTSNSSTFATVINLIAAPRVELIDNDEDPLDPITIVPGEAITYTYILRNTGPTTDTYAIDMTSAPFGWGTLLVPTTPVTLAAGSSAQVVVRVDVDETAPDDLSEVVTVTAVSTIFGVSATVTDTTNADNKTGTRYVSNTKDDNSDFNNNCTSSEFPCSTINYAVEQAAPGDDVHVAKGNYQLSTSINIKDQIQLYGGYDNDFPGAQTGIPAETQIDVQNNGRGLWVTSGQSFYPVVIDNFTIKNAEFSGAGGGIFLEKSPAITLSRLIIQDSSATQAGGGIYIDNTQTNSPIFIDDVVISNTTAARGGGIYILGSSPLLNKVIISNTVAGLQGGGVYIAGGTPTISNSHIYSASAPTGGGVYQASGNVTLERNHFHANNASNGGGLYVSNGNLTFQNNFVYSNTATTGAGIYNDATLQAANNSFYANSAISNGGGIFDNNTSGLVISNTIFANNNASSGGAFYRGDSGTIAASIDYNHYHNNSPSDSNVAIGSNNGTGDPLFVDVAVGDLHITGDSPAVDAGDPNSTVFDDIDNDFRPINQGFDIGADELSGCLAKIELQTNTYGVLQEAIDNASPGSVVQVSGTCRGVQPRLVGGQTLSQTAVVTKNITLAGGYNSTFDNDPETNPLITTLDAQELGRALVIDDATNVILSNLTLTGGDASVAGGPNQGGGLYNSNIARLSVIKLTIIDNQAANGAGVYNLNSSTTLSQTYLLSNTASANGGGLYNASGQLNTEKITAAYNSAFDGGGFYNAGGAELDIQRSLIHSNIASNDGAGIYNFDNGTLTLVNTMLVDNQADTNGGGLYNESANLSVRHDVFYLNQADRGAGIYHDAAVTSPVINSTILISNTATTAGGGIFSANFDPTFRYNDVVGNGGGNYGGVLGDQTNLNGNIAVDPNFLSTVLTETNFLKIPSGSPVEDMGDPNSPIIIDIDDDPRPSNQNPDIGVDEVAGCFARINTEPQIYGSVQTAIDNAAAGDVIRVAGICAGVRSIDVGGNTFEQTVLITKPITIQGGYTKTTTNNLDGPSDPDVNQTILDALDGGRVIHITPTVASSVVVIEGLHLRRGSQVSGNGGAVLIGNGVVTMTHNQIYSSTAIRGGAIYNEAGQVTLQGDNLDAGDNRVYGNIATSRGGAIYNAGGTMTVDDALLYDNESTDGGAYFHAGGVSLLQNNVITDNFVSAGGGAIYNASANLTVRHNTIYSNDALEGGGLYTENDTLTVVNNIFSLNTAPSGHAIFSEQSFSPDYNNAYPETGNPYNANVIPGSNSLMERPWFSDAINGDFTLAITSPMADVGDPTMDLTYDFEDNFDTRPSNQGFDLGADELPGCRAKIGDTIYGNLQTAINNSEEGDTILVTASECRGVHLYDPGSGNISQTIHITHNLTIRGGYNDSFSGVIAETTLNPLEQGRALFIDNSSVEMSNFIIYNGNATGLGGGPNVSTDDAGGGLYLDDSTVSLANVFVVSNTAEYGGGIFVHSTSTLSLTNESEIYTNTVTSDGAGIYNAGTLSLNDSKVYDNLADGNGGGIYNADNANLTLIGNEIYANNTGNFSDFGLGGGLYNRASAIVDLGNRFYSNRAFEGAAIYQDQATGNNLKLWNTFIYNNQAFYRGGAIYNNSGDSSILHNTFYTNQAQSNTGDGGAIFLMGGSPAITNNIFALNNVNGTQNAIYAETGGAGANIGFNNYSTEGAATQVIDVDAGSGNVTGDPLFVNVGESDFRLRDGSPAINVGQNLGEVDYDFENNPRPINAASDMGADEFNACLTRVRSNPDVWYGTIQKAIEVVPTGGVIEVAIGECEENVDIGFSFTIDGQYTKNFSGKSDTETTVINGLARNRVVNIRDDVDAVTLSDLVIYNGKITGGGGGILNQADALTITNVTIVSNTATADGGGLYLPGNSTEDTIVNLNGVIFDPDLTSVASNGNMAGGDGGAVYVGQNVTAFFNFGGISKNEAQGNGGGVYIASNSDRVEFGGGFPISQNEALNGGGIYNAGPNFYLVNKQINQNSASNGAGIYATGGGDMLLVNPNFYNNQAVDNGGGFYYDGSSSPQLYHATINANEATNGRGGGIYNTGSTVVVSASIVAFNRAGTTPGTGIYGSGNNVRVNYTLQWDNSYEGDIGGGIDNKEGNPQFREPGGDLLYNSPAIDAVPMSASTVTFDRFREPREDPDNPGELSSLQLCAKDMGRDEYSVGERLLEWVDPPPGNSTLAPTESVTYTFGVSNLSQNYSDFTPVPFPGNGYTETVTINVENIEIENWSEIVDVTGAAEVVIAVDGQSATMLLGPGQEATIKVKTTVPEAAPGDAINEMYLEAVGQQCTDGPPITSDSLVATTRVEDDYSFEISPDHVDVASPGQVLTFTHILTNTGNKTDSYILNSGSPTVYLDGVVMQPITNPIELDPGMTATIVLSVTVSPAAGGGIVKTVSAIATSNQAGQRGADNTLTISYTTGTRHVSTIGKDFLDQPITTTVALNDNNCTQPDTAGPCRSLRWALEQAAPGDLIKIEEGLYDEVGTDIITTVYKSLTVTQIAFIDKEVTLRGGYDSLNWAEDPPNHISQTTILDVGNVLGRRAIFVTDNPTRPVTIDRLTIVGGNATQGGGIYNEGADLKVTAVRLQDGNADTGGGLYSNNGDLLMQNNFIHGHNATTDGGAVYVNNGTAALENNTFYDNSAQSGGAVYIEQGTLSISNTIVASNTSSTGAAVHNNTATATSDHNLYIGNSTNVANVTQTNDRTGNPSFVDVTANPPDLHIRSGSDALESGNPASTLDIDYDNDPRPLPVTVGVIDIGADERKPVQRLIFVEDEERSAEADSTVVITHTLTNDGDVEETVTLTQTNQLGWGVVSQPAFNNPFPLGIQESIIVTITYQIPATATGLINITTITATSASTAVTPVSVVDTIQVQGPRWDITKVAEPSDTVEPGGLITYTLTVTNSGEITATEDFTITDQLPSYVNFVSADPALTSGPNPALWRLSNNLGISESLTVTLVVSVNTVITDGLAIVNEGYNVTGGGTLGVSTGEPVTVTVSSQADVSISKAANAASVSPGDTITYTITITNNATSGPVVGASITDTLPTELIPPFSFDFISPATGTTNLLGNNVTWDFSSTIPPSGVAQVQVSGQVDSPLAAGTVLTNTFGITASNIPAAQSGSLATLVTASNNITLSKTVEPVVTVAGSVVTYTVTLTNSGDGVATVALTDILASGFDPASVVITDVIVPGRNVMGDGVTTRTFTATAPITADTYFNSAITATYGLSQATLINSAPVTISAIIVDFSSDAYFVDENDGPATIIVTLSSAAAQEIRVDYQTSDLAVANAATADTDYTAVANTVIIPAGQMSATFQIPITDDTEVEGIELLQIALSNPQGGASLPGVPTTATLTIVDNEAAPTVDFSAATYRVGEGVGTATFTVTLSAQMATTATVRYNTVNVEAVDTEDFIARSGILTFPASITEATFTVPITDDNLYEANEIFLIELSEALTATLGTANNPAEVTIIDNDLAQQPSIEFAQSAFTVNEPNGPAVITLTLSAAAGVDTEVTVTLTDGTATGGVDYVNTSINVIFNAGVTETTFTIPITNDIEFETPDETLSMTLSSPVSATLGSLTEAELTIIDDDFLPTIDFLSATYSVIEGDAGQQDAVITVTLSAAVTNTVSISYTSTGNTATGGSDYTDVVDTLTFPPNTTVQTFTVPIFGDTDLEGMETITLTLDNPINGTLNGAVNNPAVLQILDDEAVTADFSSISYTIAEDDLSGQATITVTLSGDPGQEVSVDYRADDGTATLGDDYGAPSGTGTLTFNTGITEQTFTISINNDALFEADETVILTLFDPTLVNIGSTSPATLTITNDDDPPLVDFTTGTYTTTETAGTGVLTVTLNAVSGITATVNYSTSDNTAEAGSDYISSTNETLTFEPGETQVLIEVPVIDDDAFEINEDLLVTLSSPTNANLVGGGNNPATLIITSEDTQPTVGFESTAYSVVEDDTTVVITVTLSAASATAITVDYEATDGPVPAATSPDDYELTPDQLTFTPGLTVATFTVQIYDDAIFEGDHNLSLTLSNASGATLITDTATLTILDDDTTLPDLGFSLTDYTVDEGVGTANITVTLSSAAGVTVSVTYTSTDGTATNPADYTEVPINSVLEIAPGQTSATFPVTIIDDGDPESNETLTLGLSGAISATLVTDTATLTILDNDTPTVNFSASKYQVDEDAGPATITVTLSITSAQQVTVDYDTSDGSATLADGDYGVASGTLTFTAGITLQTFTVPINNDGVLEGAETVSLTLSSVTNANLGNDSATLEIIDDDASTIEFDPNFYVVTEGIDATALITVTMTPTQSVEARVEYSTSDVTATDMTDYANTSGTLIFPPDTSVLTFTVSITDDSIYETTEQFQLDLTKVVSANIGSPTGTVTIINDDIVPTVDFEFTNYNVDEDVGAAVITLTLTPASEISATVVYTMADGTADRTSDYTAVTDTVTFLPGETLATFTVPITDDDIFEDAETVQLYLSLLTSSNATLGTDQATLTIIDNDSPPEVRFSEPDYRVQESVGDAVITVTLSTTSGLPISVDYEAKDDDTSTDNRAIAGSDYTAISGTLRFEPGTIELTFTVAITDDALFENDEPLSLTLSNQISATLGLSQATLIIRDNDDQPTFDFSTANYNVDEDAGSATITVTLSAEAGVTQTIGYRTDDDTASSTQDYVENSGVLTFAPGVTALDFSVVITDDLVPEADEEDVLLSLFTGSSEGGVSVITTSVLTILDNDGVPDSPILIAPPNGTVTNTTNIDLIWSRVTDALTYTVYLTRSGVGGQLYEIVDPGTGTQVVSSTVLQDGVYSWTVAAIDDMQASSGITDTWVFTIDTMAPDSPSLIAPPDETLTNDPNVTFVWSDVPDAVSYRLALTSPTNSDIFGPYTTTSAALLLPDGDGVYTWTVQAIDAATNASTFTDTWTLTLDRTPPTSPTLILPPDGSVFTQTDVIDFEWTASVDALSGPVTYTLTLNGTPTQTLTLTSTTLTLPDGVYNWTVSATDGAGNTAITDTIVFTVDQSAPPIPTLISPPDQSFTNQGVTFVWSASPDTLTYTLDISGYNTVIVPGTQNSALVPLPEGVYDWTVRAIDEYSRTLGYTDTWRITVDFTPPTTPTLLAPADGSVITETAQPTFEWTTSIDTLSGPVTYTLILTNSSGVATTFAITSGTSFTPPADLALDTYTWVIQASDQAGNISSSSPYTLTLQAVPSTVFFPILLKDFAPPPTPSGSDLIISNFSVTSNGDGTHRVSITAINQGDVAVADPNNFHVAVYDVNNLNNPLVLIGVQGEWFPAGGGRTLTTDVTFPTSGSITLRAWADPFSVVAEIDESNNTSDLTTTLSTSTGVSPQAIPTYAPGPQPTPTQTR